jgi:hypothetical protein
VTLLAEYYCEDEPCIFRLPGILDFNKSGFLLDLLYSEIIVDFGILKVILYVKRKISLPLPENNEPCYVEN